MTRRSTRGGGGAGRDGGGRRAGRAGPGGRAATGHRGAARGGVGALQELAAADDRTQVHLPGDLHQVDGLLLVLDAGQVGDDGVALAEDLGLGHTEAVDAFAQADLLQPPALLDQMQGREAIDQSAVEIEDAILKHPDVKEAAAIGVPDETKGEAVWCFAVAIDDAANDESLPGELAAELRLPQIAFDDHAATHTAVRAGGCGFLHAAAASPRGRGIITQNGQRVVIDPQGQKWVTDEHEPVKVDPSEWHDYTIIANGNHLIHQIDGKVTIDLTDHEEKARSLEGLLAFQIHQGPAMTVQIKDVMIKDLPDGGLIAFNQISIPSDAQLIQPPGAKPKAAPTPAAAAPAEPAKPQPKKQEVGAAIGENTATPVARIKAPKDFKVELLYSVPGGDQGSWVNLCHDDKGRIYASDQYGGLYRFTPPAPGEPLDPANVQKVAVDIRAVNGMLFAFGSLYVGVNDYESKIPSGLYRISDSNADDQLDKVELLRGIDSKGDHGVHAIVLTPDGKGLYLVCGNNAILTETAPTSPVPAIWGDDHLLARMPDGRGHNRHVMAPGGIIYRVSPDGKQFETFASGFRNIYDASLNSDGELFTYDADMEWDIGSPWYRPTRVNHCVSGADYGWRSGSGKWPNYYPDSLPTTIDIGPGSPTGTSSASLVSA